MPSAEKVVDFPTTANIGTVQSAAFTRDIQVGEILVILSWHRDNATLSIAASFADNSSQAGTANVYRKDKERLQPTTAEVACTIHSCTVTRKILAGDSLTMTLSGGSQGRMGFTGIVLPQGSQTVLNSSVGGTAATVTSWDNGILAASKASWVVGICNSNPGATGGIDWQADAPWEEHSNSEDSGRQLGGATHSYYVAAPGDTRYKGVTPGPAIVVGVGHASVIYDLGVIAPANTVAPAVSGGNKYWDHLFSTTGTWTGVPAPTFTYQWQRSADGVTGWAAIAGAPAIATYQLKEADIGQFVRCVVTATNAGGNTSAASNVIGPVIDPRKTWVQLVRPAKAPPTPKWVEVESLVTTPTTPKWIQIEDL